MSYREKINVYVPQNVGVTLDNDAALFEIVKGDKISINRNRFLSMLIVGYYNDYVHSSQEKMETVKKSLLRHVSVDEIDELAETIVNTVVLPEVPKRKGKSPKKLSLKPTAETEGIIIKVIESLGENDYVSQYFCRMLMSYCEEPLYERERIVFRGNYEYLKAACDLHRPITFTTIWNKRDIHEVIPYEMAIGQDEMFNYLLCQEIDSKTGEARARTYRLNRIERINYSSSSISFSDSVMKHLERMKEYGAQYIINDDEKTCVKLSDYGLIQFNRIYQGRPKYDWIEEKDDGHYFHFSCSKDQIYFYFRRYDAGAAEIIFPESLRKRMVDFHRETLSYYSSEEGATK